MDTPVAACYITQSHAGASVTQVYINAHQSITLLFTYPVLCTSEMNSV